MSRGPPSRCCTRPCFPSGGSCTPARGSCCCCSSCRWSWPPGCPPGCVGCTSPTSTYPPCRGSCVRSVNLHQGAPTQKFLKESVRTAGARRAASQKRRCFTYLFDSCCSKAPHCLSNSPQVEMILRNAAQAIQLKKNSHGVQNSLCQRLTIIPVCSLSAKFTGLQKLSSLIIQPLC